MSQDTLLMGRKLIRFMKIHDEAVQVEIVPFLTQAHTCEFTGSWFTEDHLKEVEELLQTSVELLVSFDKQTKEKVFRNIFQNCLVGDSVRLGFNVKRKPENHTLLRRTRTGKTSCRVFGLKLIVFVCPRLHSSLTSTNQAFSQLLTGSGEKNDQTEISNYFSRHKDKPTTSKTGKSTHRAKTSVTTTTMSTTTSATTSKTRSSPPCAQSVTSLVPSGMDRQSVSETRTKNRCATSPADGSKPKSASSPKRKLPSSPVRRKQESIDDDFRRKKSRLESPERKADFAPTKGLQRDVVEGLERHREEVVCSGGRRTALKNMLQRKGNRKLLSRKKNCTKQNASDSVSHDPFFWEKLPDSDAAATDRGIVSKETVGKEACSPRKELRVSVERIDLHSNRLPHISSPKVRKRSGDQDIVSNHQLPHVPSPKVRRHASDVLSGANSPSPKVQRHNNDVVNIPNDQLPRISSPKARRSGNTLGEVTSAKAVNDDHMFPVAYSTPTSTKSDNTVVRNGRYLDRRKGRDKLTRRKLAALPSEEGETERRNRKLNSRSSPSSSSSSSPQSPSKKKRRRTSSSEIADKVGCKKVPRVSVIRIDLDDTSNMSLPDLNSPRLGQKEMADGAETARGVRDATMDDASNMSLPDLYSDEFLSEEEWPCVETSAALQHAPRPSSHSAGTHREKTAMKTGSPSQNHRSQQAVSGDRNMCRGKSPEKKSPRKSGVVESMHHDHPSVDGGSSIRCGEGTSRHERLKKTQSKKDNTSDRTGTAVRNEKTEGMKSHNHPGERNVSEKPRPRQLSTAMCSKREEPKTLKNTGGHKPSHSGGSHDEHKSSTLDKQSSDFMQMTSTDVRTVSPDDTLDCYVCEVNTGLDSKGSSSPVFCRSQKSQEIEQQQQHGVKKTRRQMTPGDRSPLSSLSDNSKLLDQNSPSLFEQESPCLFDQDSPSPTRQQHSAMLNLSDEELTRRVMKLKEELMAVYKGDLYSDRHSQYMKGGLQRRQLDHQVHLQHFREGQEDVVMDVLLRMFSSSEFKDLDFMMRVMLPEALMRVYKQVTGSSWDGGEM